MGWLEAIWFLLAGAFIGWYIARIGEQKRFGKFQDEHIKVLYEATGLDFSPSSPPRKSP